MEVMDGLELAEGRKHPSDSTASSLGSNGDAVTYPPGLYGRGGDRSRSAANAAGRVRPTVGVFNSVR